jgi:hypothetical protein
LRVDAVASWFDTSLEAAAAQGVVEQEATYRASLPKRIDVDAALRAPTMKTALATAQHLSAQGGAQGVVLGYQTAPATLARRLNAEDPECFLGEALSITLAVARSHCEAGVSALLLVDEQEGDRPEDIWERSSALLNVAQYYETPVVYLCRHGVSRETAEHLRNSALLIADSPFTPSVVTFPVAGDIASAADHVAASCSSTPRLVLSAWDLDPETAAEDVVQLGNAIAR